ncbi:MAG: undecaprenyl/decaprenyl-phosphate alpha-N-acetylglucosaminyl 1-phosphate transferase [Desulfobacterales bacterium]|nr:undecaprenyl/decaprenyl-phosphate alpha-N-acetylglucosaminyl 1-phosphate transferase [Desulfobacterales bacterium]
MTTILAIFLITLILALALTPLAGKLGIWLGAIDMPDERKVHTNPIPRTGGIAIFTAFITSMIISSFFSTNVSDLIILDRRTIFLFSGGLICFGIGLFDDFHRLGPKTKFFFQLIGASLAFWGGLRIQNVIIFGNNINFGFLSYLITVIWFLLFINAVNIVDGLDGLAGGIVVFVSLVMVILSILQDDFLTAIFFAAMAGGALGFLRYNFNPASIFLGDGGSYFLGYSIAGFSIMGSVKSQVSVALLIPLLALGIPLFDTLLSPLRRFIFGKKLFQPDSGHFHHRLLEKGLSTRHVVWIIYLITLSLCIIAVALINIRDERAGLFLIVLGAGAVIFVRKLGYFEYFGSDKIFGWFKDLTDTAGLSRDRRSFLSLQVDISKSKNFDEMWQNVARALQILEFEVASLYVNKPSTEKISGYQSNRRKTSKLMSSVIMRKIPPDWKWSREPAENIDDVGSRSLLRLEIDLLDVNEINRGTLLLVKDLRRDLMTPHTLKRVEQLRGSIISTIDKLSKNIDS